MKYKKWMTYAVVGLALNILSTSLFVSNDTWKYLMNNAHDVVRFDETSRKRAMQDSKYVLMVKKSGVSILADDVRFDGSISFFDPTEATFYAFAHALSHPVDLVGKDAYFSFPIWRANSGYDGIDAFIFNDFERAEMRIGVVTRNSEYGVSGDFRGSALANIETFPIDTANNPKLGFAQVFATLEDGENRLIDILLLFKQNEGPYVFLVLDEWYLNEYGGILFGMSGSPILQEGKIIGALTGTSPEYNSIGFMTPVKDIVK